MPEGEDILVAEGADGQVEVGAEWVTIKRRGLHAKLNSGLGGDKRIPLANITAVRLKEPGLGRGYIQFTVLGGQDKGGLWDLSVGTDENRVLFGRSQLNSFVAVKERVEAAISRGAFRSEISNDQRISTIDVADQLEKLASLRDKGVLTEEEFTVQKAKLLAN